MTSKITEVEKKKGKESVDLPNSKIMCVPVQQKECTSPRQGYLCLILDLCLKHERTQQMYVTLKK